jgi:hypothetical protein
MRNLFILLATVLAGCGNHDDCSLNTPCSTGSGNHYQFCNGGTNDDCYYLTGDGHRFHCLTCGDCGEARTGVTAWCSTQPAQPSSANNGVRPGLTCSGTVSCPSGGRTYDACATSTGTQCTYHTSDGSYFDCGSCSDCQAAVNSVLNWCNGSTTSSGGTTTSGASCQSQATSACQTCCSSTYRDGANYYADSYITCGCTYCASACSTAGDVCHGGSTQTPECASCLSNAVQQNCLQQIESSCAADAPCNQFLACVSGC